MWEVAAGGLAGAGLGLAGSAFSAHLSGNEAKKMRKFQRQMYMNRYRYTMADMKAAGLNPMLAYKTGVGSSPSGAMGSVPDMGASMTGGLQKGIAVASAKAQIAETNSRTALNDQRLKMLEPLQGLGELGGRVFNLVDPWLDRLENYLQSEISSGTKSNAVSFFDQGEVRALIQQGEGLISRIVAEAGSRPGKISAEAEQTIETVKKRIAQAKRMLGQKAMNASKGKW